MNATMLAKAAFMIFALISASETTQGLSYHAANVGSLRRLARMLSEPSTHVPESSPPGRPKMAGVWPAGNASRNHFGLS